MDRKLKVLVSGTGFAGEGHTDAFRAAGADVVGIVGRTPSVVKEVSERLAIPYAGTDWKAALEACQPDIVAIATPGGAHYETILMAIEHGCHIFCDKPMTHSGETAVELYEMARQKGVKTAFAASFRYTPSILHAKQMVADGAIGEPTEVESISHFNLEREIPFGWSHSKAAGGGRLNNNFTHSLSIVTTVIGEKITGIIGDVRDDLGKAPIVDGVHNFMTRRNLIPKDLNDPDLEWGTSDVEWSYTVQAKIDSDLATQPVSVLFKHGGLVPRFDDDHIVFYGTKGAIYIKGHYGTGQLYHYGDSKSWEKIPTPQSIIDDTPKVTGDTEVCWHYLARALVNDISGNPTHPYQDFRDGCKYQQLIDIIRKNNNWTDVTTLM
jgi:predicted dehydrogenase